jgi:diadenosine tetraphosphate (Ap4A) HIT family hydrolase
MDNQTIFEKAWQDPEKFHAIYVDTENGFMVLPDAKPVTGNHVMVIPKEPVANVDDLSDDRYRQLWELVRITRQHLMATLKPKRGVGTVVWGNQVPHVHVHVFARNEPGDGKAFFEAGRVMETPEYLEDVKQRLNFPPELQQTAAARVKTAGFNKL